MYIDIFPVKCRCEAKAVSKKNKPQCTNTFMITSYTNLRKNLLVCCRHKHPKLLIDSKFRNIKFRLSLVVNKGHSIMKKINNINKQYKDLNAEYYMDKANLYSKDFMHYKSLTTEKREQHLYLRIYQLMEKIDDLNNTIYVMNDKIENNYNYGHNNSHRYNYGSDY